MDAHASMMLLRSGWQHNAAQCFIRTNSGPCRAASSARGEGTSKHAANKLLYTEREYLAQQQAHQRDAWAESVREATGGGARALHAVWEPKLDPPAILANVAVVLISPRRPVSIGTVARACSCFEVTDIRIVQPRCEHNSRHAKSASKGAQYMLHKARTADSIAEATEDCAARIAFTRWVDSCPRPHYPLPALPAHPAVRAALRAPMDAAAPPPRVALVFGREELGMADDEVAACDAVCSIPIGRLQESLSLSHAVSLALYTLFHQRLAVLPGASALSSSSSSSAAAA